MNKRRKLGWTILSVALAGNIAAACNMVPGADKERFETHATQAVQHIHEKEFLSAGEDFVHMAQDCDGEIDPEQIGKVCAALEVIKKYSGAMLANNANNPQHWTGFIPRDNTNFVKLILAIEAYNDLLRGVDHDIRHRLYESARRDVELVIVGVTNMVEHRKRNMQPSEPETLRGKAVGVLLRNHDPVAELEERRERLIRAHHEATH